MGTHEAKKLLYSKGHNKLSKKDQTECKKYNITNYRSDRKLVYLKYTKNFKSWTSRKQLPQLENRIYNEKEFSKDATQMAEKSKKFLGNSELEVKTTLRFHLAPVKIIKISFKNDNTC